MRLAGLTVAWLVVITGMLWAIGALWYDGPGGITGKLVWLLTGAGAVAVFRLRPLWKRLTCLAAFVCGVMAWWFSRKPSNDRDWLPDVEQLAWAEIEGDFVTVHNVRHCDYRSENDYTPRWETRTVRLSAIRAVDIAITYWGSPWMAHPIVSFQFEDAPPLAFSIETRKEKGETYSALGGLYRQFELIYTVADERDVLRLRTNFRQGEDMYLYRTSLSGAAAKDRFLEYIGTLNELKQSPRWYNALTTNCTTAIRSQHRAEKRTPWDWRLLVNGKMDEMLHETGAILNDGLLFAELKARAHVNPAAREAGNAADFSQRIRAGRPGFGLR